MSAKKSRKSAPTPVPTAQPAAATAAGAASSATGIADTQPWIESTDPRKRLVGKIAFFALWIYVAALWLLALNQWFKWGIFGPKIST